ncbi:hypothetical protein IAT40_000272 [Kwoniella sp. CBS 6097]
MAYEKEKLHIIVNPAAGHGKAPELIQNHVILLLNHLHIAYEVHTTTKATDEREIARVIYEAAQAQAHVQTGGNEQAQGEVGRKIPVLIGGGDGTAHEFVQGILEAQAGSRTAVPEPKTRLGWELIVVPAGSGNALFSSLFPPGTSPSPATQTLLSSLPSSLSTSLTDEVIYQLSSLFSFLSQSSSALPLPLTRTTLLPSLPGYANSPSDLKAQREAPTITSHIVLSTSLHAAILHTSDALREQYPGVERFKVAAQQNVTSLFHARMKLYPLPGAIDPTVGDVKSTSRVKYPVEQYNPKTGKWVTPFTAEPDARSRAEWDEEAGVWALEGPFAYLISTATVDRFESNFVISPLTSLQKRSFEKAERTGFGQLSNEPTVPASMPSTSKAPEGTDTEVETSDSDSDSDPDSYIYLTILRPLRDPLIKSTPASQRGSVWSKRAFQVIGQAYQGGKHVDLTFPPQPKVIAKANVHSSSSSSKPTSISAPFSQMKEKKKKKDQEEGRDPALAPGGNGDGDVGGAAEDGEEDEEEDEARFKLDERAEGEVVVESFRVGGFDWIPYILPSSTIYASDSDSNSKLSAANINTNTDTNKHTDTGTRSKDEDKAKAKAKEEYKGFSTGDARLICADGAIYHLADGGVASVRLDGTGTGTSCSGENAQENADAGEAMSIFHVYA